VRRAEQDLVAANARIGVAWSQYLPTISLTASNGFASDDLSLLTKLSSNFGSFGVAVFGPVYTGGRIAGQRREAEALQEQATAVYLRSVQTALREVDDALTAHGKLAQQNEIRRLQLASLREQRDLARKRYDNGYTSFFPVIDAEQALTAGQLLQNEGRREQFRALIAVYKAMGGGWALPELAAARAPTPKTIHD
jgi:multidrug efflux system outer membrane protein